MSHSKTCDHSKAGNIKINNGLRLFTCTLYNAQLLLLLIIIVMMIMEMMSMVHTQEATKTQFEASKT